MKTLKKALCLVIAITFAFAPVVSADQVCYKCKSPNNELRYPFNLGQGAGIERITYELEGGVRSGYLDNSRFSNAKLVVRICECPSQATNFQLNRIIGIQLTIMNEGVYWTDEPIGIQAFQNDSAACAGGVPNVNYELNYEAAAVDNVDGYKQGDVVPNANGKKGQRFLPYTRIVDNMIIPGPGYFNHAANIGPLGAATAGDQGTDGGIADGIIGYLRTLDDYQTGNGTYVGLDVNNGGRKTLERVDYEYFLDRDGVNEINAADVLTAGGPVSTTVATAKRVKMIRVKNAYQIGTLDQEFGLSRWWVDLPEMRLDKNVVKPLDELKIKVELLSDTAGGVCVDCKSICQCDEVVLGIFGSDKFTMYFPYVLTQANPWGTGIALTNLDTVGMPIESMEAVFTLTDGTGKAFTYKKTDFETSAWATMLDGILDKFSGTPSAGAAWLKVETNFMSDGYEFLSDGVFGAGTHPRIIDNQIGVGKGTWRGIR